MSLTNKEILLQANACVTAGDNEGFLAFCTEDISWEFVGDRVINGKEAVRAYMQASYLEPPKFDVENLVAEGDFVIAAGRISMKEDTGKETDYAYCDVWRFRGGKMAALKAFVIGT